MNKKVWSPCCFVKSTEIKKAIANCTSLVLSDKRKKSALPKMYGKVQSCSAFNQRWCNIIVHDKNKTCSVLFSTSHNRSVLRTVQDDIQIGWSTSEYFPEFLFSNHNSKHA